MGQIIIDIPAERNFHYEIENTEKYQKILKILDDLSVNSLSDEDLDDILYAETVTDKGDFIGWGDAKSSLQ